MANYVIGDNKCFKEAYTKAELDDGTAVVKCSKTVPWDGIEDKPDTFPPGDHHHVKYKEKNDFANITTTLEFMNPNAMSVTRAIHYPSGFTKSNCTIISLMAYNPSNNGWESFDSTDGSTGHRLHGRLGNDYINVSVNRISKNLISGNYTTNIRIVLMKY